MKKFSYSKKDDKHSAKVSNYDQIICEVFRSNYSSGTVRVSFTREELVDASTKLEINRVKNLGDIPYSYRFRKELPDEIKETAPDGAEWIITGTGIGLYEFRLAMPGKILPSTSKKPIKVPDATPEIIRMYAPGTDEQALLTRSRYNRLVDLFTGLTCYSIQNHLRTTVENIGQVEVDEVYVGINKGGTHFVIPCQAKSPKDSFGIAQVLQDMALCARRYPNAICIPLALQFLGENEVVVLELNIVEEDQILNFYTVDEQRYLLVSRDALSVEELLDLKNRYSRKQ